MLQLERKGQIIMNHPTWRRPWFHTCPCKNTRRTRYRNHLQTNFQVNFVPCLFHLPLSNFFPSGSMSFTSNISSKSTPDMIVRLTGVYTKINPMLILSSIIFRVTTKGYVLSKSRIELFRQNEITHSIEDAIFNKKTRQSVLVATSRKECNKMF